MEYHNKPMKKQTINRFIVMEYGEYKRVKALFLLDLHQMI